MTFIKHRNFLAQLLNLKGMLGEGCEVGTERGGYADLILRDWNGRRLHMVDPFITQPMEEYRDVVNTSNFEEFFKTWQRNIQERYGERAVLHRKFSHEAVLDFADASLDFVFIDGNHGYKWVKQDLELWWPKLRPGGLFGGHDYGTVDHPDYSCGVKQAVDEFVVAHRLEALITPEGYEGDVPSWWIWKP